jgi:RNA polymerase sigma-70 factor (ECF subfamily)
MSGEGGSTDELLARAGQGDRSALGRLLAKHRRRLRRLVAERLDQRLKARVDPSDVVQEALIDAERRLPEYLRARPVGFFPWLRGLTLQRLIDWHRLHLGSRKRSVTRELPLMPSWAESLVERLVESELSPSGQVIRDEQHARALAVVETLSPADRDVLDLRYVQDLPFAEMAEKLGIGLGAVKMRHLRALERVRTALNDVGTAHA